MAALALAAALLTGCGSDAATAPIAASASPVSQASSASVDGSPAATNTPADIDAAAKVVRASLPPNVTVHLLDRARAATSGIAPAWLAGKKPYKVVPFSADQPGNGIAAGSHFVFWAVQPTPNAAWIVFTGKKGVWKSR